jgi:hypothetical protein
VINIFKIVIEPKDLEFIQVLAYSCILTKDLYLFVFLENNQTTSHDKPTKPESPRPLDYYLYSEVASQQLITVGRMDAPSGQVLSRLKVPLKS